MNRFLLLSLVLGTAVALAQPGSAKPTFVLVHGALFDSSGWARVQGLLQERGFDVALVDVPGRNGDGRDPKTIDIKAAAAKVCLVAQLQAGPTILVGHSQGGALITQALDLCPEKVQALVFVAAVVPLDRETAFQRLSPERDVNFAKCVVPRPNLGILEVKRDGPLEESFFQDLRAVDAALADRSLNSMVSEPILIGNSPLSFDVTKYLAVPKFYIEATLDKIISIETQRSFQQTIAMNKVFSVESGHCPFLSKPVEVVNALVEIGGGR